MTDNETPVRLSTVVMTHPARLQQARALVERLTKLDAVCVVDDSAGAHGNLHNALRAWSAVPADVTHHLVLQDDVIPCDQFAELVTEAVRNRPDDALSLFCEWGSRSANLVRVASWQSLSWALAVDMYTPSQGLVLPRRAALEFVATVEDPTGADDLALSSYLRRTGRRTLVTVPNLLEHDDHPSLTGNGFQGLRRSVCPDPGTRRPRFDTATAGEGLVWLPYASWMRVHAEWFYCGGERDLAWFGEFADTMLPDGLRKPDLASSYADDLAQTDPSRELAESVSELTLFEFWTTYFALGLTMPGPVDAVPGALAETAFGTAFAGLFRRYLPMASVDALAPTAGRLAMAAFRNGAAADIERPYEAWHQEAPE